MEVHCRAKVSIFLAKDVLALPKNRGACVSFPIGRSGSGTFSEKRAFESAKSYLLDAV